MGFAAGAILSVNSVLTERCSGFLLNHPSLNKNLLNNPLANCPLEIIAIWVGGGLGAVIGGGLTAGALLIKHKVFDEADFPNTNV